MQSTLKVEPDDSVVFGSKCDFFLMRIIGLSLFVPFAMGAMELWKPGGNVRDGLIGIGIAALATMTVVIFLVPLIYELTPTHLLVRCGILKYDVPLSSIQAIKPTRNPLSAPALSLDRLQIDYIIEGRRRLLLISPQDKAAFLNEVAARVPDLSRHGDELRR